jgi:hypothetical protein
MGKENSMNGTDIETFGREPEVAIRKKNRHKCDSTLKK